MRCYLQNSPTMMFTDLLFKRTQYGDTGLPSTLSPLTAAQVPGKCKSRVCQKASISSLLPSHTKRTNRLTPRKMRLTQSQTLKCGQWKHHQPGSTRLRHRGPLFSPRGSPPPCGPQAQALCIPIPESQQLLGGEGRRVSRACLVWLGPRRRGAQEWQAGPMGLPGPARHLAPTCTCARHPWPPSPLRSPCLSPAWAHPCRR